MKYNRVLIFSTDDHLYPAGGAEQAFGNITARLPHIKFDLICAKIRPKAKRSEKVNNVNIHRLGFGLPKIDGFVLALFGHYFAYRLLRKHEYDLIWSIMASYGAFSAVRLKKKTGLPLLLTLQEGDSLDYIYQKVKFVRKSFNQIFTSADGVQAISNYLLDWGKRMGYQGKQGVVIPNGVDIEAFSRTFSADEIDRTRRSFGFNESSTILFTTSRLEPKNGIGDVVTALSNIDSKYCFVICGSGSLESTLKRKVIENGLDNRVKFMGFVNPNEIPLLMRSADIFIRPSLTEGLGNAFLEAMASRLITVGTNAGGIPDFLIDGETGFMVEKSNPKSIKLVIEKISDLSVNEIDRVKNNAEQSVQEKYDWNKISLEMESLFNNLTKA